MVSVLVPPPVPPQATRRSLLPPHSSACDCPMYKIFNIKTRESQEELKINCVTPEDQPLVKNLRDRKPNRLEFVNVEHASTDTESYRRTPSRLGSP